MFRKIPIRILFLLAAITLIVPIDSDSCSLAVLESDTDLMVARTMDWETPGGYVVKNYPGTRRRAQLILFNPYRWTSRFGSISLNLIEEIPLFGEKNVPGCGLNEKGLYAAELWVTGPPAVRYPCNFRKPWLTSAEVVQMLLDNCATVDEAIAQFKKVSLEGFTLFQIFGMSLDLHYFVADSSGKTAVLEYPAAKRRIYNPPAYSVMTNNFHDASLTELSRYQGFGGTKIIPETVPFYMETSLTRYVLACDSLVRLENMNKVSVDSSFMLLQRVATYNSPVTAGDSSGITTQWSVVYDLKKKEITYTSSQNPNRRVIKMNNLNFPVRNTRGGKKISVQSSGAGDITNIFLD